MDNKQYLSIKEWSSEDRPREKLLQKGRSSLTDAELIAILIGSGSKTISAVDLSKLILNGCDNDINKLAGLSVRELQKFKGIGEAKAITIVSALELGRRRKTMHEVRSKISSSNDAYQMLRPHLIDKTVEEAWLILMTKGNSVIKKQNISTGGQSITIMDPKVIYKIALEENAASIIVAHNHPSGQLKPSNADKSITKKLLAAGQVLDIAFLDHIIFTNFGYFSFADEGILSD